MLEIEPVDEKKPEIVLNLGTSNVRNLSHHLSEEQTAGEDRLGVLLDRQEQVIGFKLSPKSLLVDDQDSDPDSVKFVVANGPEHGKILRKSKSGLRVEEFGITDFTQCEYLKGRLKPFFFNENKYCFQILDRIFNIKLFVL
jgi:hypothetical protein